MLMRFVTDFHQQLHSRHLQGHGRAQTVAGGAEDIAALLGDDLQHCGQGAGRGDAPPPPDLKRPGTLKMLAIQHQVSAAAESAAHTAATHDRSVVYYGPHTWRSRLYTGQSDPKLYVCFAFCYNKVIIQ